ncbi:MAG: CvpA family protein, partial [Solibacillus sp.]
LPVLSSLNYVLGAVLGFIEMYLVLFIGLYVVALLPVESIQTFIDSSILAGLILEHTPIITSMFQNWWYIQKN